MIAVDAKESGALLGLVDTFFLSRGGGAKGTHKTRAFEEKDSRRWLSGAMSAVALSEAGAASVTVVEDREGDIYEGFALKPANVELLVRAAQDRNLVGDGSLFAKAAAWKDRGQMTVALPAVPGRKARTAVLGLSFGEVEIARPANRNALGGRRASRSAWSSRATTAPAGETPARWVLITTHKVASVADARWIVGLYRARWTIEQLFRTMKTKGFDVEALRQQPNGPLEKLATAILIAAIKVMQLVAEREGRARRPTERRLRSRRSARSQRVCRSLEGQTAKQRNRPPPGPSPTSHGSSPASWRLLVATATPGKPGPIVMLRGLTEFQSIKHS